MFYFFLCLGFLKDAWAAIPEINIDRTILAPIEPILNGTAAKTFTEILGLNLDIRSYEPATPLGTFMGLDLGLELTYSKPPSSLSETLSAIGAVNGGSASILPGIPIARVNVHKGLNSFLDVGLSGIYAPSKLKYIGGSRIIGVDFKVSFFRPEEGPTFAFKISYNLSYLELSYTRTTLTLMTQTITPGILVSKNLGWIEPYLGASYQMAFGNLSASLDLTELLKSSTLLTNATITPLNFSQNTKVSAGLAYLGFSFKFPFFIGFRFTPEFFHSSGGENGFGVKSGFRF